MFNNVHNTFAYLHSTSWHCTEMITEREGERDMRQKDKRQRKGKRRKTEGHTVCVCILNVGSRRTLAPE